MNSVLLIFGAIALGAAAAWFIMVVRRGDRLPEARDDFGATLASVARAASPTDATQLVASTLRERYQVERLAFLRKQRRFLQVELLAGLPDAVRQQVRIQYQPSLVQACIQSFEPRQISHAREMVPEATWQKIDECHFTHCLPVFWGEHVYGLLMFNFPESQLARISELGALSQALASVYHLQWTRQSLERLAHKPAGGKEAGVIEDQVRPARQILKLVRHRNSETVVRKLINAAQSEIGLDRFVCIFEPRDKADELQIVAGGVDRAVRIPGREQFGELLELLSSEEPTHVSIVTAGRGPASELGAELAEGGITYAVLFQLSTDRRGVFAWGDKKPAEIVANRLAVFHAAAEDLLENAESFERIEELSQKDSLTGLYNFRYFQSRLAEEVNRARRYKRSLGLVMIDLDQLKNINDAHGHQSGDAILQQVGTVLRSSVREIDVIARYGGDEFCVIMPEADLSTCEMFMARLRAELAAAQFQSPTTTELLSCTISLGAAVFPDQAHDAQKLVFGADMALLKAKEQGRNTFVVFDGEHPGAHLTL